MPYQVLDDKAYKSLFQQDCHVFNSVAFNTLNQDKADEVVYLGFPNEGKTRIGICVGIKNNEIRSPFSAPFGGFNCTKPDVKIPDFDLAVEGLIAFAKERKVNAIRLSLPPWFYSRAATNKQVSGLLRNGFVLQHMDLNFSYDLSGFDQNYASTIWSDARRNLKIAQESNELSFEQVTAIDDKQHAYEIIKQNRAAKGFPLHLSWDAIQATEKVIKIDFFLVRMKNGTGVASAILFHTDPEVAQVVYWGDLQEHQALKPMNFMAFCVFGHYKGTKNYIDIGPSTENGVPNVGLCNFKESIGCEIHPKFNLVLALS